MFTLLTLHGPAIAGKDPRREQLGSKDFEVWSALGALLSREEKFVDAENALKKALAFKPDDPATENELVKVYKSMGRYEEAVQLSQKGIKQRPQDYWLHFDLAQSYVSLGRYAEAKEAFARAKAIDSKEPAAYIHEGYALLHAGEDTQAKESFESLIRIDTASPFGYHHLASYFFSHGQFVEAEASLKREFQALEADPKARTADIIEANANLGAVIRKQGRLDEAEAVFRNGLKKMAPDSKQRSHFLLMLAKIADSQGKRAQAEDFFKRAVAASEAPFLVRWERLEALVELGRFYLKQGRRPEAAVVVDRAGKLDEGAMIVKWDEFSSFKKLAELYRDLGDVSRSEALYVRLMAIRRTMPRHPGLSGAGKDLADLYVEQSRLPEAEDLYHQAIEIFDHWGCWEEEAVVFDSLAAAYEKGGKRQEADEAREKSKALRARPFNGRMCTDRPTRDR
ncbi:MAG: hypothetical protein A2506_12565 [Elusimicrobia bacterium RIFOXYD12_FULL_66_9]|nr:MAG: hypothetical protein A2506_12565 [Elusimicrobia bacterium RIFOXYD12_FULL_66_9]